MGAFLFPEHTVLVDAPLHPEDGRAWLAALHQAGASPQRTLVYLDSHLDRTLGAQTLQASVVAHEEITRQMSRRAVVFKTLRQETGAAWENTPGLTGLRLILPQLTFSHAAHLHFDGSLLQVAARTGVAPGASWLIAPEEQVLFVGDALALNEPPFLDQADIPAWLEQLEELQSRQYKDFTIIAGRGGKADGRAIKQMQTWLKDVHGKLRAASRGKAAEAEIEKLAARYAERYKPGPKVRAQYTQRLRFGMQAYAARHFSAPRRK
ncbi:MAG: MBL fold metallo-hydrolase [Anaerolineales bacterium]|nr:MBL fold metallo-hydrolase [Anaerolineales bacterium]